MAFYILALLSPPVARLCLDEPLVADFSGGHESVHLNIKGATAKIRATIQQRSDERRAVAQEQR